VTFKERWKYEHGDPSVKLFDLCVQAGWIDLPDDAAVLELGCCETDFAKWFKAATQQGELIGVDVNATGDDNYDGVLRADASTVIFPYGSFDAVILLGALEHFGLGYYGDPVNASADIQTVENAARWLKPGGFLYYDVPWTPETYYITENKHFRVYDDTALQARLTGPLRLEQQAWADGSATPGELVLARPEQPMVPFWYCARLLRKDA
jgi:SAM-dependent methyltransferase